VRSYDINSYGPAKVAGEKGTYKLTVSITLGEVKEVEEINDV